MASETKPDERKLVDNHANQLNRNSDAYWQSRGYPSRPHDWATRDPNAPPPVPTKK